MFLATFLSIRVSKGVMNSFEKKEELPDDDTVIVYVDSVFEAFVIELIMSSMKDWMIIFLIFDLRFFLSCSSRVREGFRAARLSIESDPSKLSFRACHCS